VEDSNVRFIVVSCGKGPNLDWRGNHWRISLLFIFTIRNIRLLLHALLIFGSSASVLFLLPNIVENVLDLPEIKKRNVI
jgi:hypothetical protein